MGLLLTLATFDNTAIDNASSISGGPDLFRFLLRRCFCLVTAMLGVFDTSDRDSTARYGGLALFAARRFLRGHVWRI